VSFREGQSPRGAAADGLRALAFYRLPGNADGSSADGIPSEWAATRAARPEFAGHAQPQVPSEFGYCDVREAGVREAHAALAREYGLAGFCYVFRAPASTSELDPTLGAIAASGLPELPFCVCWETTELHAGAGFQPDEAAGQRLFSREECAALMRALIPVFADARYIRVAGRPLFVVSSPDPLPEMKAIAELWREQCKRAGLGDPCLAVYGWVNGASPDVLGFDAIVECPQIGSFPRNKRREVIPLDAEVTGDVRSYRSWVGQLLASPRPDHTMFRTVVPGWDETPRAPAAHRIFVGANPETFGYWIERACEQTRLRHAGDARLLFVRAWNEWNAGCHLEPDAANGRRYLEVLRAAVQRPPSAAPVRPAWSAMTAWLTDNTGFPATRVVRSEPTQRPASTGPRVSVVMPAYNHERYIAAALDSVLAQTHRNLELIVIDDGSSDATGSLLDDYARRCGSHAIMVVHQANAGAHAAINHGLALARGEVVAIMNSDDLYAPTRIARLLQEMDRLSCGFAFSSTRFIDDDGREVEATNPYAKQLRTAIAEAVRAPDPLHVLVYNNIAISTGNFMFRRELLERVGGFCAMRVCHDWDFLLAVSHESPLALVNEPLYEYRLHGTNTFVGSRVLGAFELEQVLSRFFDSLGSHRIAADQEQFKRFLEQVRRVGLGGYLRQEGGSAR
jgi:glycosyltransferase involved in cell wall biosynthesis